VDTSPGVTGTPKGERLIDAIGVSKEFKRANVLALESATLHIDTGEFVALLGPSGCGKSTLLHLLGGLTQSSSGSIFYRGARVNAPLGAVGIAFQDAYLLEWRNVRENVLLQMDMRGIRGRARRGFGEQADRLLDEVGLGGFGDKHVWELSGGMKQRVALCRSLIHDPELLLLDEPFGALDMLTRDQLNVDLSKLTHDRNKTALLVTHSISEAVFLSNRVLVMGPRPGRIVAEVDVDLPMPRELAMRNSKEFTDRVNEVYAIFEKVGVLRDV